MRFQTLIVIGSLFLIALPLAVWAESSSSNYILWGQAVASGGARSTSSSYINYGTIGDAPNGEPALSANFYSVTGFEGIYEDPKISMSISSNTVALAPSPLTASAVSFGETTLTVSTNADFGYALSITETTEFQTPLGSALTDVADGEVTTGNEEYGIAVSGADAAFGDDRSISSAPRTIASRSVWGGGIETVVTFKAAVSNSTPAGAYSGTSTFIVTTTF